MPSHPTRRTFIATSLAASAAVSTIDPFAEVDVEPFRLMERRKHLQSAIAKLDRQWALAYAKLPSWCRPGPKYRDQDGRMFGGVVGWPDLGLDSIMLNTGVFLVRPSIRDVFELRRSDRAFMAHGESERLFVCRLEAVVGRLRQQRRVERAVALPRSSAWLPLEIELEAIELAAATRFRA